jgi:hypothetical protein
MPTAVDPILVENIKMTLKDVVVQVGHAQNVKGPARTSYYKMGTLLLASSVEAMLHDIIKCAMTNDPNLAKRVQKKDLRKIHPLPSATLGTSKSLFVCEEVFEDFRLDKTTLLGSMNTFAKKTGLINKSQFNRIDSIRQKRNEIHLQGRPSTSRSFTLRHIRSTSKILEELANVRMNY